jgi:hypothetical protein
MACAYRGAPNDAIVFACSLELQETPPFGSAFIKSVESVKSVAAFCF